MALTFFCKLQQRVTLTFLAAFPTLEAAAAATLTTILDAMSAAGRPIGAAQAEAIVATLRDPHLHADPRITRAKARLMLALVAQLQVVLAALAEYDRAIGRPFAQHADHALFASLPRAGKRLAPRLLAEWGDDRTRSADAAGIQALAGTSPVPFASGKLIRTRKRYACNKPLRNALPQFA